MKNFATVLTMLLFVSNMVPAPAADLDRNSFNLVKVNKGDFMLCEKLPETTPPPPKLEEIPKVESPKKVDGPKIEPRPMPKGKVVEEPTAPQTNPVYTDGSGNIRRKAEDGNDWYWSPNNGGFWWRSASGPAQQGIPRTMMPAPQTFTQPYCPNCPPSR